MRTQSKNVSGRNCELTTQSQTKCLFIIACWGKTEWLFFLYIHSLNTTIGTSIFEPVAAIIAQTNFPVVKRQYTIGNQISEGSQIEIQHLMNELSLHGNPDKESELSRIRRVCQSGAMNKIKTVKADLLLENREGVVFLVDIKTAKPNIGDFKNFKRNLLEWAAIYLESSPEAVVPTCLAMPYNPYEPKPYQRWTLRGMLDMDKELMIGEEFWDFLGGRGTYAEVLDCFEKAGIELRPELDAHFSKQV